MRRRRLNLLTLRSWQGDKDTRSPPFVQPKLKLQPGCVGRHGVSADRCRLSYDDWYRNVFNGKGNVGPYTV